MFGYVIPDKPNMFIKDFTVYKAFYCGLCKSIGKECGQIMRFTTNYDITFLSVLAHAVMDVDVEYSNENCILNPLKKKSIVKHDELNATIVDINTILAHYKLIDNIEDDNSFKAKTTDNMVIKKHYKRAVKRNPNYDEIVKSGYEKLRELEKSDETDVNLIAEPFGNIMRDISKELCKESYTEDLGTIMYNIGKWIYLVDAIDDVEEDFTKKHYNVFLENYEFKDRTTFLNDRQEELRTLLMDCYNAIGVAYDNLKITKYEGVITNILWYGILDRTKDILRRTCKCKKTRI